MLVANEYTQSIYDARDAEIEAEAILRLEYFARGGTVKKCPALTPGGLRVYSRGDRPERGLILTPEGVRVNFKESE